MKKLIFFLLTILIAHKLMAQTTTPKTETENKPTIAILDGFANAFNAHDVDRIYLRGKWTDSCENKGCDHQCPVGLYKWP